MTWQSQRLPVALSLTLGLSIFYFAGNLLCFFKLKAEREPGG